MLTMFEYAECSQPMNAIPAPINSSSQIEASA